LIWNAIKKYIHQPHKTSQHHHNIIMRLAFGYFTSIVLFSIVVNVYASSYKDGFITGILVKSAFPVKKKLRTEKYNTVIIDTSLIEFPPQKKPICHPIEIKKVNYRKIPLSMKLLAIAFIVFYIHCNYKDPESSDFMTGYFLGKFVQEILQDK